MDCEMCRTLTFPALGMLGSCEYANPGPETNCALFERLGGVVPNCIWDLTG